MKTRTQQPLSVLALIALLASSAIARKHETGFLDRTVSVGGETYRYQVYVPRDLSSKKKWPIILFLHGVGERGDDGLQQTDIGIGHAIRAGASRFPFIVVMPQCRKDKRWIHAEMQRQAFAALEQAIREFHGDRERTYLTGLSMGGYGTWDMTARYAVASTARQRSQKRTSALRGTPTSPTPTRKPRGESVPHRPGFSMAAPMKRFQWRNRGRWRGLCKTPRRTFAIPNIRALVTTCGTKRTPNPNSFHGCWRRNYSPENVSCAEKRFCNELVPPRT